MYQKYIFELKPLPYPENALEPYIDTETVTIHHGKHQQNYVDQLNRVLAPYPQYQDWTLERLLRNLLLLPPGIITGVRNNGGGVYNHMLYWESMAPAASPEAGKEPVGLLEEAIKQNFGSFDQMKEEFTTHAKELFGSGYVFLVLDVNNGLQIISMENQDSPLTLGFYPLMAIDLWEHAYYLKYQNRRAEYIDHWWKLVNWTAISRHFEEAVK